MKNETSSTCYTPTEKCSLCNEGNKIYCDGLCVKCYRADKLASARVSIEADPRDNEKSLICILDYLDTNEELLNNKERFRRE